MPAQWESLHTPQKTLHRQVKPVGGETHWGFILLRRINPCMHRVGVCASKWVHICLAHWRSYWQLLRSLKAEWKFLPHHPPLESWKGKPPGFASAFLFKQSCIAGEQVQLSLAHSSSLHQLWHVPGPAEGGTLVNCSQDIKCYSRLLQSCCISEIPAILNLKHSFGRHVSSARLFPLHPCAWLSRQQLTEELALLLIRWLCLCSLSDVKIKVKLWFSWLQVFSAPFLCTHSLPCTCLPWQGLGLIVTISSSIYRHLHAMLFF